MVNKTPKEMRFTMLDPRRWDECSELFKRTCRVASPPGSDRKYLRSRPDLRAVLERYHLRARRHGRSQKPRTCYRCASTSRPTINLRPSPFRLPPWLTSTSDSIGAFPTVRCMGRTGPDSTGHWRLLAWGYPAKDRWDAPQTAVFTMKTIRYGRASSWSGNLLTDYGDLFNYLAPALLTLWVAHVQLIVPCGGR